LSPELSSRKAHTLLGLKGFNLSQNADVNEPVSRIACDLICANFEVHSTTTNETDPHAGKPLQRRTPNDLQSRRELTINRRQENILQSDLDRSELLIDSQNVRFGQNSKGK
jgi:hypothetical protein